MCKTDKTRALSLIRYGTINVPPCLKTIKVIQRPFCSFSSVMGASVYEYYIFAEFTTYDDQINAFFEDFTTLHKKSVPQKFISTNNLRIIPIKFLINISNSVKNDWIYVCRYLPALYSENLLLLHIFIARFISINITN